MNPPFPLSPLPPTLGNYYLSSETTSTIPSLAVSVTTSLAAAAAAAASATKYVRVCCVVLSSFYQGKRQTLSKTRVLTLVLLQKFDCLELLNDVRKGVGNDGDHDQESKDQDEDGGHY